MKRFLGHCMAGVTVLVAAAAAAPACVHNDKSLFVSGVRFPPARSGTQACVYTSDITQAPLSSGILDIAFRQTYEAVMLVGNQLSAKSSIEQNRAESNRISIQGVTVRVTDAAGTEVSSFTRLSAGIVEPGTGTLPNYGLFSTTLIDPTAVEYVRRTLGVNTVKRLVSYTRVFGETLGGQSVESNEFEFPVDLCYRCLVTFGPETVDKALQLTTGVKNCKASTGSATSGVCVPGQDQYFPCTTCQEFDVCDPTYTGTPQTAGTVSSQTPLDAGGGG